MTDTEPAPRPAATLVLLRDVGLGPEVLLLRRRSELAFYGGAWVFPGGAIDEADRAGIEPVAEGATLAAQRAAVRELREEAGLELGHETLLHFSQWVTPPGRSRRFDTWFFAAAAQASQVRHVHVDDGEVDAFRWMAPELALAARRNRELELPPPTFVTLSVLASAKSVEHALATLANDAVRHYAPRICPHDGSLVFLYAGDAGYETRDPSAEGPRHRLVTTADDWRYEPCSAEAHLLRSPTPR